MNTPYAFNAAIISLILFAQSSAVADEGSAIEDSAAIAALFFIESSTYFLVDKLRSVLGTYPVPAWICPFVSMVRRMVGAVSVVTSRVAKSNLPLSSELVDVS